MALGFPWLFSWLKFYGIVFKKINDTNRVRVFRKNIASL